MPGGEQAEGALARLGLQEVAEVVQLILQIAVRQHDPLHRHMLVRITDAASKIAVMAGAFPAQMSRLNATNSR